MDLVDGMRTFVAVVEAGSFTGAAERLDLSNKLVSKYVAALEKRLGLRLLHRTTRTSSLTEAGVRYHEGCVELLARLDELEGGLREDELALRGTLRVAAPVTYGEMQVAPLLARFRAVHPALSLELQMSDRYVDLANEGFDVAIRVGKLADSGLVARRIASTDVWTVASAAYLKERGTPRSPDALKRHDCIRDANFRSGAAWTYSFDGQRRSVAVAGGVLVNSARSVRDLALAGAGIGLCPSFVVADDVREKRLVRLLARHDGPALDVYAVYPTSRNLSPKVRVWVDFLVDELGGRAA